MEVKGGKQRNFTISLQLNWQFHFMNLISPSVTPGPGGADMVPGEDREAEV